MKILETDRLILQELTLDDAPFILALLNEPSFLEFIGDRGVRTVDEAREYVRTRFLDSYERHGFGLYLTLLKGGADPIGICGLVKRENLDDVDVGFAFLPAFWSRGYAFESASAVMDYARGSLGLSRIVAITSADNHASIRLLEKLGMGFERWVQMSEDEPPIKLFATKDGTPA